MVSSLKNRVLVFGTFDLLHAGHLHFLCDAKALGSELWVVVARDQTVEKLKGQKPLNPEKKRLKFLQSLWLVDRAVLGLDFFRDKYAIVKKINPSVIALGYDQGISETELRDELSKRRMLVKVVRMKPYKERIFKTSKLKGYLCACA